MKLSLLLLPNIEIFLKEKFSAVIKKRKKIKILKISTKKSKKEKKEPGGKITLTTKNPDQSEPRKQQHNTQPDIKRGDNGGPF